MALPRHARTRRGLGVHAPAAAATAAARVEIGPAGSAARLLSPPGRCVRAQNAPPVRVHDAAQLLDEPAHVNVLRGKPHIASAFWFSQAAP